MTTKSMAYDHPAYTAVYGVGQNLSGSAGKSAKYGAFCAQIIKSVSGHVTQGTSADILNLISISGTATTTTALVTAGSASPPTGSVTYPLASGGLLLNAGDAAYLLKGTDATLEWMLAFEIVNQPLAPVTL